MLRFAFLFSFFVLALPSAAQMQTPEPPAVLNLDDRAVADLYRPVAEVCHQAITANNDPEETVQTCRKAANVASRFSTSGHFIERRAAFTFASMAYSRDHLWEVGLIYADRAIAVVEQGHDDPSGASGAYDIRAEAEVGLGKLKEADRDLDKAEQIVRRALLQPPAAQLEGAPPPVSNKEYAQNLKGFLTFHAQVLSALNRTAEAQARTAEAARL